MLAPNSASDQTAFLTGSLLGLIHQGKASTARWLREYASLRTEVSNLVIENTESPAALAGRSGEAPS
jgi:hypothetical protein